MSNFSPNGMAALRCVTIAGLYRVWVHKESFESGVLDLGHIKKLEASDPREQEFDIPAMEIKHLQFELTS